jgi:hypothetical protein
MKLIEIYRNISVAKLVIVLIFIKIIVPIEKGGLKLGRTKLNY